ncbi:MAG: lipid IV(A) 3-deoxy-D-manno-octulosonic acid transferase [Gammaproteobacteria bacterium]|nr:lipid IV(A) 3-deoxy-D-manno-octulosonic acid transferase [Gammaproteobacteria bacterium]
MIRLIYTVIYYLIMPVVLIRLLWRSRHTADYRKRWNERFGYIKRFKEGDNIWVHAVSVGETMAAIPLVKALIKQYSPRFHIIVTTTTPTGSALVKKYLRNQVTHVYAPFDTPTAVSRFLRRARVKLCIILETELWPNLLSICRKQKIPVVLANARLSEKSFKRYQLVSSLTKKMLSAYHTVAAQGVLDGERYLHLGLDPKKLIVTGNIKFDLNIPDELILQGKEIRQQIGAERRVLIAASTHEGEDSILLDAFEKIRQEMPTLFLILAPRHPDRFTKVLELCRDRKLQIAIRSQKTEIYAATDILLLDTIGELQMIYAACDIAFVGGSLVPTGGHNIIEPAALGLPILTGPHLHNFTEISKLLQNAGAAQVVTDAQGIAETVVGLCNAKELREKIGLCAKKTIEANRGALQQHLECIARCVSSLEP